MTNALDHRSVIIAMGAFYMPLHAIRTSNFSDSVVFLDLPLAGKVLELKIGNHPSTNSLDELFQMTPVLTGLGDAAKTWQNLVDEDCYDENDIPKCKTLADNVTRSEVIININNASFSVANFPLPDKVGIPAKFFYQIKADDVVIMAGEFYLAQGVG